MDGGKVDPNTWNTPLHCLHNTKMRESKAISPTGVLQYAWRTGEVPFQSALKFSFLITVLNVASIPVLPGAVLLGGDRDETMVPSNYILDLFLTETVLLTGSRRQPGLGHFWERGREFAFSSSPSPMAGRATWNKYHSLRQRGRPPSCLSLVSFGEPWFKRLFYFSLSDDDYHSFDMNPWSRSQKWAK